MKESNSVDGVPQVLRRAQIKELERAIQTLKSGLMDLVDDAESNYSDGAPGFYNDNKGVFEVVVNTEDTLKVPEPSTLVDLFLISGILKLSRRKHTV